MSPADQDVRQQPGREHAPQGDDKHDHPDDNDHDGDHDNKGSDDKDGKDKPRSRLPLIIAGVLILVAIIAGIIYWVATSGVVTTDDAYTDGTSVSLASNVSGYVTALHITDNSFVHAGDLLLTIDPREDAASLQQQQANLALAQSQLASSKVDLEETEVKAPAQLQQAQAQLAQALAQQVQTLREYRRQTSADQRATAATDVDQATEQLRAAEASVKQAQAQVASASLVPQMISTAQEAVQQRVAQLGQAQANLTQAQVKLSYNEIRAPQDGWITMRNADLGTYVQAGQQIFYIVSPRFWVTVNFKETQLQSIKLGDHVRMTVDAYPGVVLYGHIDSIQAGSGAQFSAFPAENATGNFVKIVRRVPVKVIIDNTKPAQLNGLPLGISVEPSVTIK